MPPSTTNNPTPLPDIWSQPTTSSTLLTTTSSSSTKSPWSDPPTATTNQLAQHFAVPDPSDEVDYLEEEDYELYGVEEGGRDMWSESVDRIVEDDVGVGMGGEVGGIIGENGQGAVESTEIALELDLLLSQGYSLDRLRSIAVLPPDLPPFEPICPQTTLLACRSKGQCPFPHFDPIIRPWTDPSLGFCSYLNLCYGDPLFAKNPSLATGTGKGGTKHCRYQHFRLVAPPMNAPPIPEVEGLPTLSPTLRAWLNGSGRAASSSLRPLEYFLNLPIGQDDPSDPLIRSTHAQWLNMDARAMTPSLLGQFDLILADPPWDIHMSLPYGTLSDDDCRSLALPDLQPTWGLLAMWVTGRAMELARELFKVWGYRRIDEIVWVKVGQLGGLVKTGRTGHWLNHTCEHLLIALKLPPPSEFPDPEADIPWTTDARLDYLRRGVDGDVVVSEVRETSRKPEEFYGILERMVPGGRRLEVFGRKHNTRPGWLTIGNQLEDNRILETGLLSRLRQVNPAFTTTELPEPEA